MSTFEEMIQNVTVKHQHKIKKFCQPLVDHLGVSHFSCTKITNSGKIYLLSSNPKWSEYYFSEKFYLKQPHFRHPRNFQSSITLAAQIENKEYDEIRLTASQKFNVNFGLGIIKKVSDGVMIFGFDSNTANKLHSTLFLNEIALLRRFVAYFTAENQFILKELENHQVSLIEYLGSKFDHADIPVTMHLAGRDNLLEKLGFRIKAILSDKDKSVLRHLLNGYSATQIAGILKLSPRTIEHGIERAKNKLSCFSKSELIRIAKDLELFGYLD